MAVRFTKNSLANPGIVTLFISDVLAKLLTIGIYCYLQVPTEIPVEETEVRGPSKADMDKLIGVMAMSGAATWLTTNLCYS